MTDFIPVALFDMDGTLCDYVGTMISDLEELRSPDEVFVDPFMVPSDSDNPFLWKRMDLIKADESWWADLPKLSLGFDVLAIATELGYSCEVLTQSPRNNPAALAGKLRWIRKNLGDDMEFTMTRNKSRHYGRVFVDDYPGFIIPWLEHRKNGIVIMPVNRYNKDFRHDRVIAYDGTNKEEVRSALKKALSK